VFSGPNFQVARRAVAFLTRHRVRLLDAALFLDAFLMLATQETVLWFHVVFVLLSLQAFYLRFRPFVLRAAPWVTFTTLVVLRAVRDGSTQPDELIEIPLLTLILFMVFAIAARRESARAELDRTKTLLEQVLETTEDGIFVADEDGRIVLRNRVAIRLQADSALGPVMSRALRGETVVEELALGEDAERELVLATAKLLPHGRGALLVTHDITTRKKLEEELAFRASHDPLTNLANRAMFRERALAIQARQRRVGGLFALMLLDLDDFKKVNDSLGHAAGDSLLVAVSQRIGDTLRGNDVVARLGGDEFAILLDDVQTPDGVTAAAERILATLRMPFAIEGRQLRVEASLGIVTSLTNDEMIEDHLRNADIAMYVAKTRGKARYALFDHSMHEAVRVRLNVAAGVEAKHDAGVALDR
jgi:diguanylate cyclase (GGDEF)-like protein